MISDRKFGVYGGLGILAAFFFYGFGSMGIPEAPGLGEFLILLNSLLVVGVGILFYLLIKDSQPGAALVYLASRLIEGVFLALGGIFLFLQREVPGPLGPEFFQLANDLSFQIGMFTLGVGSMVFFSALAKSQRLPHWLAVWGVLGYGFLALGSALDFFGTGIGMYFFAPGGLFEVFIAIWLIFRGFKTVQVSKSPAQEQ
jgi:hypothetical protein